MLNVNGQAEIDPAYKRLNNQIKKIAIRRVPPMQTIISNPAEV
jgi:hypothetical protein